MKSCGIKIIPRGIKNIPQSRASEKEAQADFQVDTPQPAEAASKTEARPDWENSNFPPKIWASEIEAGLQKRGEDLIFWAPFF